MTTGVTAAMITTTTGTTVTDTRSSSVVIPTTVTTIMMTTTTVVTVAAGFTAGRLSRVVRTGGGVIAIALTDALEHMLNKERLRNWSLSCLYARSRT